MENAMRMSKFTQCSQYLESGIVIFALVSVMGAVVSPIAALAQDKKNEISHTLVSNSQFVACLRDEVSLAGAVDRLLSHSDLDEDARDRSGTLSISIRDADSNGIELYYDLPRTQCFDSTVELVIKPEPFDVRKWLKDVWAGVAKVAHDKTHFCSLKVAV
jgi:catechol-2,3-dioxygenase